MEFKREFSINTPSLCLLSSQVIQWSVHHSKLSSSLFSGFVMTICYRLIYSKTCLKPVLFCLFLLNFFVTYIFCSHYIIFFFLVDLYPCMIILKYNQTFGVLIYFVVFITPPPLSFFYNLCFVHSFVFSCIYPPLFLQMNMHSNTHASFSGRSFY